MEHDDEELISIHQLSAQLGDKISRYCVSRDRPTKEEMVEDEVLPKLLGEAPDWAKRQYPPSGWTVMHGNHAKTSVFCVYYGTDRDTGQRVALVQRRKEMIEPHSCGIGPVGGYCEAGEEDFEAMLRETAEEVCDPDHQPIFTPRPENYVALYHGVARTVKPAINFQAFAYELSVEEMQALKDHIEKLKNPAYCEGVLRATDEEVTGMEFRPLDELALPRMNVLFTYPGQHYAYVATQRYLERGQSSPRRFDLDPRHDGRGRERN